ncbi:MAG: carboxypeptidase-like regulatory domain-containing protein [Acidobacteria bacterium]|nr:carboxypeptidase-like regulatory domain-containing protein [Acidobacteriota bacterium]
MRFLLLLGFVGLGWAQDPLEGMVVNGFSGSPLGQVAVYIYDEAGISFDAMTDASGRYRFVRAKPGLVRLRPTKRGFFADGGLDQRVDVTAGMGTTVPVLKLWPGGVISGTVTDEAGEPMAEVSVTVLRRGYPHGRRHMVHVTRTITDDRGEYRLYG